MVNKLLHKGDFGKDLEAPEVVGFQLKKCSIYRLTLMKSKSLSGNSVKES